jgi:hypothetical protein
VNIKLISYIYSMKSLIEIYNSDQNVRESDIPKDWLPSFHRFMFGSAFYFENGTKDIMYYIHDFRSWYSKNRKEIDRDERINKILE